MPLTLLAPRSAARRSRDLLEIYTRVCRESPRVHGHAGGLARSTERLCVLIHAAWHCSARAATGLYPRCPARARAQRTRARCARTRAPPCPASPADAVVLFRCESSESTEIQVPPTQVWGEHGSAPQSSDACWGFTRDQPSRDVIAAVLLC